LIYPFSDFLSSTPFPDAYCFLAARMPARFPDCAGSPRLHSARLDPAVLDDTTGSSPPKPLRFYPLTFSFPLPSSLLRHAVMTFSPTLILPFFHRPQAFLPYSPHLRRFMFRIVVASPFFSKDRSHSSTTSFALPSTALTGLRGQSGFRRPFVSPSAPFFVTPPA